MNIGQQRGRYINTLCPLLGYSRQAFYQHKHVAEVEALQQELVIQQVLVIRERQKNVGTRKLFSMLQSFLCEHGISLGRDGLFKLLADYGLLVRKRRRKAPRTTFSDHWMRKYPNLIEGLSLDAANMLWVSDITYISTSDGFGYLSLTTDAYSRKIVGYCLSKNLAAEGCLQALKMALKQLPQTHKLIHHSDRGCQYCCTDYVEQLSAKNIAISMTQNSDPRENAIAERVNGILKIELLDTVNCKFKEAKKRTEEAIYIYNYERLHSSIEMATPHQAHSMNGPLKRHWKNYYTKKEKEVTMT
jgi:putative transposase